MCLVMSNGIRRLFKIIVTLTIICVFVLLACDKDKISDSIYNGPPHVTFYDTINTALGLTISDTIDFLDTNGTIRYPYFEVVGFDGPTDFGDGLSLDTATGEWSWDIGPDQNCTGTYNLLISRSDLRRFCNNENISYIDTVFYAYYKINVSSGISISIDVIHDQLQGHEAEVSISLNSSLSRETNDSSYLYMYDFMIGYDTSVLTFIKCRRGAAIVESRFDYFDCFFGPFDDCGDDYPSGLLVIAAIQGPPVSSYLFGPGELAKMTFLVSSDYNYAGEFVPIRFYWCGCNVNRILEGNHEIMLLGQNVYDHDGNRISDSADNSGYSGPEDSCYDTVLTGKQSLNFKRIPAINFRNGGIAIIPISVIDDGCDINLNGIINDIGDAVILANYFIYGPSVFTIDYDRQVACTDVNSDGIPLTVEDFVYLVRIITGDAIPNPQPNPCAFASFLVQGDTVGVESNVELGAVRLVFSGSISPQLADDLSHMELYYNQVGNQTNVLIFSFEEGDYISSGDLLYFTGDASLDSVETAEYRGTVVNTVIE